MWTFSLFSKSHIGHVNHGKSENICGVDVSSTFVAVMRCSYQFFAVLRYSEPPNAPLLFLCIVPPFKNGHILGFHPETKKLEPFCTATQPVSLVPGDSVARFHCFPFI